MVTNKVANINQKQCLAVVGLGELITNILTAPRVVYS